MTTHHHRENILELVLRERERQLSFYTEEHDDEHPDGEIAEAAAVYACPYTFYAQRPGGGAMVAIERWSYERDPRDHRQDPPKLAESDQRHDTIRRRHDLVKAMALLLAEYERLERAERHG